MTLTGLILDMDGTLFDSDSIYGDAMKAIGVDMRSTAFQSARSRVKNRLGPGHVCARNRVLYLKEMLEANGNFSARRTLDLIEQYEQSLSQKVGEQWRLLERTTFLEKASERFKIVLLTNENTRTQLLKLRAIDPDSTYFKWMITSEETGVEKPDRKMFDAAFSVMNLTPRECVMVGDDWEADIKPALKLGCFAALNTEFHRGPRPLNPPPYIESFTERFFEIKKLNDLFALPIYSGGAL